MSHTWQQNRAYVTCTRNCCIGLGNWSSFISLECCVSTVSFLMLLFVNQGQMNSFSSGDNNKSNHSLSAYKVPGTRLRPSCSVSHFLLTRIPPFLIRGQLMHKEPKECGWVIQFLRVSRSCWTRQLDLEYGIEILILSNAKYQFNRVDDSIGQPQEGD